MPSQKRNLRSSLPDLNRLGSYDDQVKAPNNSDQDSPSYSQHSTNCPSPSTSEYEEIQGSTILSQSRRIQKQAPSKRGLWSPEEDSRLIDLVEKHGRKWAELARMMPGKGRRQIRNRYMNALQPEINWEEWTDEEQQELYKLHAKFGNQWCSIAAQLPGRTENQVKNKFYWNQRHKSSKIKQPARHKELKPERKESQRNDSYVKEIKMLDLSDEEIMRVLNTYFINTNGGNNTSEDTSEEY
jgi:hypothetical protein